MSAIHNLNDLVVFRNSQKQKVQGTLLKLSRTSLVIEVYNPYSIVQLSEVLSDVVVSRGNRPIYEGRAVVSNLVNTGLMLIISATLVDPWTELLDLEPGPALQKEVRYFIGQWDENYQRLDPDYKLIVIKIRNFLQEFNIWLEQIELSSGIDGDKNISQFVRDNFATDIEKASTSLLDEMFETFTRLAEAISEDDVVVHKLFAQHELHPLTLCSPFMYRTFSKPLGYAGDYEMVNMILNNRAQGTNTYAKIVDAFSLRTKTAQAHRNRVQILFRYLQEEAHRVVKQGRPMKVLNVGCGPAFEVQQFISRLDIVNQADLHLIDFNEETLNYTRGRIDALITEYDRKVQIKYTQKSVHNLLREAAEPNDVVLEEYDLVYCAGLFDYVSDKICKRLVGLFYHQLIPGGAVVVTNVSKTQPVKGFMEHLQEWYLILRDEAEFSAFAPRNSQYNVFADDTGVNIFLEARKRSDDGGND